DSCWPAARPNGPLWRAPLISMPEMACVELAPIPRVIDTFPGGRPLASNEPSAITCAVENGNPEMLLFGSAVRVNISACGRPELAVPEPPGKTTVPETTPPLCALISTPSTSDEPTSNRVVSP